MAFDLQCLMPSLLFFGDRGIALSYDDGPDVEYTPRLLATLERLQIKATFFLLGKKMKKRAERAVVADIYDAGHEIGIHGYSHGAFLCMSTERMRREIELTRRLICKAIGDAAPSITLVRPPFGLAIRPAQGMALRKWGYQFVVCDVLPQDWKPKVTTAEIVRRVMRDVSNGSIIALHDGEAEARRKVIEATEAIVEKLGPETEFVTVREMLRKRSSP